MFLGTSVAASTHARTHRDVVDGVGLALVPPAVVVLPVLRGVGGSGGRPASMGHEIANVSKHK